MESTDKKTFKVLAAGLWRTGTASLQQALEILGFSKCYHMKEVFINPHHEDHWKNVFDGKEGNWKQLIDEGYQSGSDAPICFFIEDILKINPDVKVILNIRDFDKWYESSSETVFVSPEAVKQFAPQAYSTVKSSIGKAGDNKNKEEVRKFFDSHYEKIRKLVPKENLLDNYEVKQGWKPLCEFLGVKEPSVSFPRVNERDEFKEKMKQFKEGGKPSFD